MDMVFGTFIHILRIDIVHEYSLLLPCLCLHKVSFTNLFRLTHLNKMLLLSARIVIRLKQHTLCFVGICLYGYNHMPYSINSTKSNSLVPFISIYFLLSRKRFRRNALLVALYINSKYQFGEALIKRLKESKLIIL